MGMCLNNCNFESRTTLKLIKFWIVLVKSDFLLVPVSRAKKLIVSLYTGLTRSRVSVFTAAINLEETR